LGWAERMECMPRPLVEYHTLYGDLDRTWTTTRFPIPIVMATQRLSTMVSVAPDFRPGAAEQLQKAAGPTTYELLKPGRAIGQWHPRATPKGRDTWSDEVCEYMRTAIPIIPTYILEGPPTMKRVTTAFPSTQWSQLLSPARGLLLVFRSNLKAASPGFLFLFFSSSFLSRLFFSITGATTSSSTDPAGNPSARARDHVWSRDAPGLVRSGSPLGSHCTRPQGRS
jgi:hypothetical protein